MKVEVVAVGAVLTLVHSGVEVEKKCRRRLYVARAGDKKSTATFCRLRRQSGRAVHCMALFMTRSALYVDLQTHISAKKNIIYWLEPSHADGFRRQCALPSPGSLLTTALFVSAASRVHRAVAGTRAESIIKHDQLSLSLLRASCSRQRLAVHSVRNRRCTSRPTVASRIIQRRRL